MAYVSTIISGAACLGVLFGLISGIFFLVLAAVKWVSRVRSSLNKEKLARPKELLVGRSCLLDSPAFLETGKAENGFGRRLDGSIQEEVDGSSQRSSERPLHWDEEAAEQKEQTKQEASSDTIRVRELLEKMIEMMIGGPLDGTTVGQLSTHSAYKDKDEDSSDLQSSNLKRLIKQIVVEAMDLPTIADVQSLSKTSKDAPADDIESKSYEDILATAILNKVIENFQSKSHKEGQYFGENPKPRVRQRRLRRIDANDNFHSDGDWSDTSRSDQLSLTIEEYIEEVTTALEASEDEISDHSGCETGGPRRIPFPESGRTVVDGTDEENSDTEDQSTATELITSSSSWEENWLFQKKRLRSTPNAHHPVPVPMLVPNPSEDFRALVGGVDADDLSDMSECSDLALEELISEDVKPSKVIREEEVTEGNSGKVKVVLAHITEEDFIKKMGGSNSESSVTVEADDRSSREQTNEEVETLQPTEDMSLEDTSATEKHLSPDGVVLTPTSDTEDSLVRCRIAEREKEKWMHPVPLLDNPYSPENIEKREQQKRTNQYFRIGTYTGDFIDFPDYPTSADDLLKKSTSNERFTRDYYVNASKHPSGMSSPTRESDQVSRHSSNPLPSSGCTPSLKNPQLYRDIADGSAEYFPPHRLCPLPSIKSQQHFSQVFRTSAILSDDSSRSKLSRRYRYGSHTVKLHPKTKNPIHRKPSLQQELSQFEQKSLRENLTHSLLRARDASPNFILNPVYSPDIAPFSSGDFSGVPFPSLLYDVNYDGVETPHSEAGSELFGCRRLVLPTACSKKGNRTSQESGYGSDSLEHSSDSLEYWRLTPPKTPEVVESSLVSIVKKRRAKDNSHNSEVKSLSSFY